MDPKSSYYYMKPQVVIVSADVATNASLQKLLNEKDYSCRGFFDVEAAINWSAIQQNSNIIYLLIPPFENLTLDDTIRSFYQSNQAAYFIALVEPEDLKKSEHYIYIYDSLEVLPGTEKNHEMLPAILRQITRRMEAERQLAEITNLKGKDAIQPGEVSKELEDISLRRFKRKQKQEDYLKKNEPENKINPAFLKNIGLEIRNPVSAMIGMARTLEKTNLNEDQKSCLKSIIISANNLLTFMDDMFYYANISSGKQELVYHSCHVRSMVDEVVELFRKQAEKKSIQLHSEVRQSVPESITADKLKIQQALNNLLAFALQNTDQGGVNLVVEIIEGKNEEAFLFFSVKDSGKGFKEEDIPIVFDSFFRQSHADKEMYHGAGLGLSIVKSLAELMGGEIGFDSVYGKGSHVYFSITLLSKVEAAVADQEALYAVQKRKLKILLAEDDAINQMYLAGFLRSQGWEVDAVYNGLDALKLLNDGNYDIIILDGQMPKMDGFETARKIRDIESAPQKKDTPILAISGYANPEDKERFFKAGMDAYLSKPIDEQELIGVICKLTK